MSSSSQAFSKLDDWRQSKTVLKLTVLVDGERPEIKYIQIVAVDEKTFLVGFLERGKRELQPRLDLSKASFEVGQRTLEVKRSETDILMFEEWH